VAAQRIGPIGIDAEMEMHRRKGQCGLFGREVRDHPLGEIERPIVAAEDDGRAADPALGLIADKVGVSALGAPDRRRCHGYVRS